MLSLYDEYRNGEGKGKWQAAKILREYLSLLSEWTVLAVDMVREAQEFQEASMVAKALQETMSKLPPQVRSQIMSRLEQLRQQSEPVTGSRPRLRRRPHDLV
jgi:hypothetical protein